MKAAEAKRLADEQVQDNTLKFTHRIRAEISTAVSTGLYNVTCESGKPVDMDKIVKQLTEDGYRVKLPPKPWTLSVSWSY